MLGKLKKLFRIGDSYDSIPTTTSNGVPEHRAAYFLPTPVGCTLGSSLIDNEHLSVKKPKNRLSPSLEKLFTTNKDDIPFFYFQGITVDARVIDVYDGDTIKILFEYEGNITKERIRIWGINAPEMDSKDITVKNRAIEARDYLRSLILEKHVTVTFFKREPFGRMLADIHYQDIYVNNHMVEKGYAVEFMRDKNKYK